MKLITVTCQLTGQRKLVIVKTSADSAAAAVKAVAAEFGFTGVAHIRKNGTASVKVGENMFVAGGAQ